MRRPPGLRLAGLFNRRIRDAAELLPRYEADNILVSDKFKARFTDFRVTTFREGLAAIRDEHPASDSDPGPRLIGGGHGTEHLR